MGGIFLGFLCAVGLLGLLGRLRARQLPPGGLGLACWALLALTGLDGLNAFLFDGGLPHAYAPNTPMRLLTGLGAGIGLALLAVPVVAGVVWKAPSDEPAVDDPTELLAGVAAAGLLGGVLLVGPAPLLWPIALLMLSSVLVAFGLANLYLVSLAQPRQATQLSGLRGPLLSSLGLALLELAALSALRGWLSTTYGFTWGF